MTAIPFPVPVWYRIHDHPAFDDELAYRALGLVCFGETSWSQLFFISDRGHTVGVQVHRCTALPSGPEPVGSHSMVRLLTAAELEYPRAGKFTNPDIATDK